MKVLLHLGFCLVLLGCGRATKEEQGATVSRIPDVSPTISYSEAGTSGLMLVECSLNNRGPLWFILDTGASQTVLFSSPRTVELGLEVKDVVAPSEGGSDQISWKPIPGQALEMGNVRIENLTVFGAHWRNFPFFPDAGSVWCDGIIGYDLLSAIPILISRSEKTIELLEPNEFTPSTNWTVSELEVLDRKPYLQARLRMGSAGEPTEVKLHFDTGMAGYLALIPSTQKNISIPEGAEDGEGWMNGSLVPGKAATIPELELLGVQFTNVLSSFAISESPRKAARDGQVGSMVLRHLNLFIDFAGNRVAGARDQPKESTTIRLTE